MPDCDYCGETFDEREAHLRHLRESHGDELGPIDRRRVAALDEDGGSALRTALGIGLVAVIGFALAFTVSGGLPFGGGGGGGGGDAPIEARPLPEHGDSDLLQDVQSYPSQGTEHVSSDTTVNYSTMPPTSGPHYASTVEAGFYAETPPLGSLVHTLEHGAVVIYYDPARITPEAEQSLRAWASNHTGTWSSVVVVPNPREDPESAYVLTAWRHMLRMEEYDPQVVRAFLAEYLGRGPENPVR